MKHHGSLIDYEIQDIITELQSTDKALERLLGRLEPRTDEAQANYNYLDECHKRFRPLAEDITSCLVEIE